MAWRGLGRGVHWVGVGGLFLGRSWVVHFLDRRTPIRQRQLLDIPDVQPRTGLDQQGHAPLRIPIDRTRALKLGNGRPDLAACWYPRLLRAPGIGDKRHLLGDTGGCDAMAQTTRNPGAIIHTTAKDAQIDQLGQHRQAAQCRLLIIVPRRAGHV
ncbi:hypothetical protein CKO29_12405 [Allochromatium vinosum]|nr:hypothetical protein [Allochromatium vinosum]